MSLLVSSNTASVSFVASVLPPMQLLSVADVSTNLSGTFWDLTVISQRNTLHSACTYLDGIEGVDSALLTSIREDMIPAIGTKPEPTATERLRFSRLITTWSLNRSAVIAKAGEGGDVEPTPSSPAARTPQTPVPPARRSPMPSPIPARVDHPFFKAPPPALVPAEAAVVSDGVESDDKHLYPGLWWEVLSRETRLGLKQLALAGEGKIREQTQNDEVHASFLISAVQSWFNEAKTILVDAKPGKDKFSGTVSRQFAERLLMMSEVLEHFRREGIRDQALGQRFWRLASENSDIRLAINRLLMRDIQSSLDDDAKAYLEKVAGHFERGVVESIVMPHFEGQLSSSASDDTQAAEAATEMSKKLSILPMNARSDLNADQSNALNEIELMLRTASQKMRSDPQSVYVSAFVRSLGVDVTRLASVIEMINGRRSV